MCGITGVIGQGQVKDRILTGLSHLEYRGYDSAGIALSDGHALTTVRRTGRLSNLADALASDSAPYLAGIGHTRWATHGEPSERNAHPQTSTDGRIAVVHNGIIENYKELRQELGEQGFAFTSDTDTEVVAKLLEALRTDNLRETVQRAVARLKGAYALGILFADVEILFAVRHESPLILGIGDGFGMIASDVPAVLPFTRDVLYLENGDLAELTPGGRRIFSANGEPVQRKIQTIDWSVEEASKGGYPHFMLKEIHEQPETVTRTLDAQIREDALVFDELPWDREAFLRFRKIWIVACGTAYHAGLVGKTLLEKASGIPVTVQVASEFRYQDPLIDTESLLILVSQSGETADTLSALREGRARGATTLAITNVVGSTLAREADRVLYTRAGREIAVASTKAYTAQLMLFAMLAVYLQGIVSGSQSAKQLQNLCSIPEKMRELLASECDYDKIARRLENAPAAFYIGRLPDHATAMEGALKLKEISYIYTEAFAAGELKHGPIALIEKGTPVIALVTQPGVYEKMLSNIAEVRARGAYVIGIGTEENRELAAACDETIRIPAADPLFAPMLSVIPTQLIAYHTSVRKGLDVDKPRNLAKSVTVE